MIDVERIVLRVAQLGAELRAIAELDDPGDAATNDGKTRLRASRQLVAVHKFLTELGLPWSETQPLQRLLEALKDVQFGKSRSHRKSLAEARRSLSSTIGKLPLIL